MPETPRPAVIQQFGRRLRALREATGLSQEDFARAAGIDRSYYSGLERGVRNPTLLQIARLAEALNVQPHELLLPTT